MFDIVIIITTSVSTSCVPIFVFHGQCDQIKIAKCLLK